MNIAFAILAVLSILLGGPKKSAEQISCPGLILRNDAKVEFLQEDLCTQVNRWHALGISVYVYTTNDHFSNEKDWFSRLDQVESQWGIYDPAKDQFLKSALTIQLSTAPGPFNHNIGYGENLFGTPIHNKQVKESLKLALRNRIQTGNINLAVADSLQDVYKTAWGTAQGTAQSQPAPQPSQPVDFSWLLWVLVLATVGVGGYFGIKKVFIPHSKLVAQEAILKRHISRILNSLSVLTAIRPEDSSLYSLWLGYSSSNYPAKNRNILAILGEIANASNQASSIYASSNSDLAAGKINRKEHVLNLEVLYLTLVGSENSILNMTEAEQTNLLDPLNVIRPEEVNSALLQQLQELIRRNEGAGNLKIKLLMPHKKTQQVGVLGLIQKVKNELYAVTQAMEAAPKQLEELQAQRIKLKGNNPASKALLGHIDAQLASFQKLINNRHWLEAESSSTRLSQILFDYPQLEAVESESIKATTSVVLLITEHRKAGFRLTSVQQQLQSEINSVSAQAVNCATSGDLTKALEACKKVILTAKQLPDSLTATQKLRKDNLGRLIEISKLVASLQNRLGGEAKQALVGSKTYPVDNWQDQQAIFMRVTKTLQDLFDDPSNSSDLNSSIATLNSFETQDFEGASRELDAVFKQLASCEVGINGIIARYSLIQEIEKGIAIKIQNAQSDLRLCTELRDSQNSKINFQVDKSIQLSQQKLDEGKLAAGRKNFIAANDFVIESIESSAQATASAKKQIGEIVRLFDQLEDLKSTTQTASAQASSALKATPSTVITAGLKAAFVTAGSLLDQANKTASSVGGEDQMLAKSLGLAIKSYREYLGVVNSFQRSLQQELASYKQAIDEANGAIISAESAISSAKSRARHPDANSHGRSSLSSAESRLPSFVDYDDSKQVITNATEAAKSVEELANQAKSEADQEIRRVKRRRDDEEEERQTRARRAAAASASSSYSSSFSRSGSSSSFGSSAGRSSSSMGSSAGRR